MNILFVEDDIIETMKMNKAIAKFGTNHRITETKNGEEALAFLKNGKLPDIILLDINMPRMNGIELLSILKEDPILKYLPVIMMTTSGNRADLLKCFDIGISGYIVKPLKFEDYEVKLKKVLDYWEVSELVHA